MEESKMLLLALGSAAFFGIVSIFFVLRWVLHFKEGLGWDGGLAEFNWHPVLVVIGFIFLQGTGEGKRVVKQSDHKTQNKGQLYLLYYCIITVLLRLACLLHNTISTRFNNTRPVTNGDGGIHYYSFPVHQNPHPHFE